MQTFISAFTCYLIAILKVLFLEDWVGTLAMSSPNFDIFLIYSWSQSDIYQNFVNFQNIRKYSKLRL